MSKEHEIGNTPGCSDCLVLPTYEIDEHGTFSGVSGRPGRPGHAAGDAHWYCEDTITLSEGDTAPFVTVPPGQSPDDEGFKP